MVASKTINRVSHFLETTIRKGDIVGAGGPVTISVFILAVVVVCGGIIDLPVVIVDCRSSLWFPVWSRGRLIRGLSWSWRRSWLILAALC